MTFGFARTPVADKTRTLLVTPSLLTLSADPRERDYTGIGGNKVHPNDESQEELDQAYDV